MSKFIDNFIKNTIEIYQCGYGNDDNTYFYIHKIVVEEDKKYLRIYFGFNFSDEYINKINFKVYYYVNYTKTFYDCLYDMNTGVIDLDELIDFDEIDENSNDEEIYVDEAIYYIEEYIDKKIDFIKFIIYIKDYINTGYLPYLHN